MSYVPDENGNFEVEGLPPAPANGQWTIYKYDGPEYDWPNAWDYNGALNYIIKLICDDGTFDYPVESFDDSTIAQRAELLIRQRNQAVRGTVADTTDIHPVPKA
jgi:hypothetical protein